jgi:hypothetical protein
LRSCHRGFEKLSQGFREAVAGGVKRCCRGFEKQLRGFPEAAARGLEKLLPGV